MIKLLLEEGLDINEWTICGHTPLHLHVKEGNFEIVKYLLSKGADINKKIYMVIMLLMMLWNIMKMMKYITIY